jgi:hypothetical protein
MVVAAWFTGCVGFSADGETIADINRGLVHRLRESQRASDSRRGWTQPSGGRGRFTSRVDINMIDHADDERVRTTQGRGLNFNDCVERVNPTSRLG